MGLFSTELNYNEELVATSSEMIKSARSNLLEIEGNLYSGLTMITDATGYDLIEKAGLNIDTNMADKLTTTCRGNIDSVLSSISNKVSQIQAYNNADDGLDKIMMAANLKFNNLKDDVLNITDNILDTGANIISFGGSLVTDVLGGAINLVENAGAYLCSGASAVLDLIGNTASGITSFITNLFSGKEKTKVNNESTTNEEIEVLEEDSDTIKRIKEKITEVHTDKKDINLSNLKEGTKVTEAVEKYADEINNAEYVTISENFFSTTTTEYINGEPVEVTHIVINDASQINGEPANGTYASGLETASSAASRVNSAILINGSHFNYSDGSEDLKGTNYIAISDGKVVSGGTSGGAEICLDSSGKLFTTTGQSAEDLVNQGVTYTFSSHGAPMIENGEISSVCYQETKDYKRTCIGMTEPLEYYITTDVGYGNQQSDTAKYLLSKGCTFAKSMDQGGSVSLVRNDTLINNPSDGSERAVGDFLYFTE